MQWTKTNTKRTQPSNRKSGNQTRRCVYWNHMFYNGETLKQNKTVMHDYVLTKYTSIADVFYRITCFTLKEQSNDTQAWIFWLRSPSRGPDLNCEVGNYTARRGYINPWRLGEITITKSWQPDAPMCLLESFVLQNHTKTIKHFFWL